MQVRIVEALARIDGALGWYAMIGSDGGFYSAFLDDAVGRAMWPDLDLITAGFITPAKASFLHSVELVTMVVLWPFASTR